MIERDHIANLIRAIEELAESEAGEYGHDMKGETAVAWALADKDLLKSYQLAKHWLEPLPDNH